jgi:beta-glucosidase/6-phospho-beta-glucosidase/beta-galactosidase
MGAETRRIQLTTDLNLDLDGIEVWGGAEYTCNRVGDRYFDQMEFSGHARRISDYEKFANLGIRTLRFGLLWERHQLDPSWRWADERLQWMRSAGVRPVASLMHHGSGPPHTNLLDPQFPEKLAAYAASVAQRYPWIEGYTPVNEPHTTARFSAMYGVWYPHHRSTYSYLRALLNQLKGTVLSMEAIRHVRPDAELIQTDDVGTIRGTEQLRAVWEKLNLRRWLPFDLLLGRVDSSHPMFAYMRAEGISEKEILWFLDHPCAPSVIGINYYVTSDRFLDDRIEMYPADRISSEGRFADVEAVRVGRQAIAGFDTLLSDAWMRYRVPVAITEVHLGGIVEEQIRWLAAAWDGLLRAREGGANCIALTVWALLGSFYWDQLVTRENGHYEPGAFDVSGGTPVLTELASVVAQIAGGKPPSHAALSRCGWWQQDSRVCFPRVREDIEQPD